MPKKRRKISSKIWRRNKMWIGILLLLAFIAFCIITVGQYHGDMKAAYERLASYDVKTIDTGFGTMSYVDEGTGEAILISHGIFGGYDQGIVSLRQLTGDNYRKISISRFGYPGSELPENPTPENQAKVFKELLDELGIEQAYILTTSAGGSAGLWFALNYPEKVKGLILLSSGVPDKQISAEEFKKEFGMLGPPKFLVNDFPMWFSVKYFGFILKSMFNSEADSKVISEMILPANPRKQGIAIDQDIIIPYMALHYDEFSVEDIQTPILIIQAKDDLMTNYESTQKFLARVIAETETVIFETGGHFITGYGDSVNQAIKNFIEKYNAKNS